jgi:hypothetical protein
MGVYHVRCRNVLVVYDRRRLAGLVSVALSGCLEVDCGLCSGSGVLVGTGGGGGRETGVGDLTMSSNVGSLFKSCEGCEE